MELQFLDMLRGCVRIRITGSSYDRFLNLCAYHGVRLRQLVPAGESYEAFVARTDFKKLRAIAKKSHASVRITQRRGLPFFIHRYRRRKLCLAGIAAACFLMLWLSAHIWNISIDGNVSQTDDVIFEYLDQAGIRHGMRKANVDCGKLAAQIRSYFSQFAWVAAELKGTRLLIHVKEGIPDTGDEAERGSGQPSDLVAARAGTVRSIYVRSGRAAVQAGDEVKKGDLLVSGALPICDDAGETVAWQYVAADADVLIEYKQRYYDAVPRTVRQKLYTGRERSSWILKLGEIPFALPERFRMFSRCDLLTEITQLRLSEHFYLPVYMERLTAKEYEYVDAVRPEDELRDILQSDFQYFKKNLEQKGLQLFENDVKIEWNEKSAIASGTLKIGAHAVNRTALGNNEEELPKDEYG